MLHQSEFIRDRPLAGVREPPAFRDRSPVSLGEAGRKGGAHACRFERMALAAAGMSAARLEMLGELLATTLPPVCGSKVLQPIWTNETMNRAYMMVRLIGDLERSKPLHPSDHLAAGAERRLAGELAAALRTLDFTDDGTALPCSALLRTLLRDLLELFGSVAPRARLESCIEPMLLPAYKRRALALATFTLVGDALLNTRSRRGCGATRVTLRVASPTHGALRVAVEDASSALANSAAPGGVVDDMASLLECAPLLLSDAPGSAAVQLVFPLRA